MIHGNVWVLAGYIKTALPLAIYAPMKMFFRNSVRDL